MSNTLNTILEEGIGYKCEDYCGKELYSLDEIINEELNILKNIDIPIYLYEKKFIDIDKYFLNNQDYLDFKNKYYTKWLKNNSFEDSEINESLFKEDCNMKNIQKHIDEIGKLIQSAIENEIGTFSDEINCIWLSTKDFVEGKFSNSDLTSFNLPEKYCILTDLDEDGILIAFK